MKKFDFWLIAALAVCVAFGMAIISCEPEVKEEFTLLTGTLSIDVPEGQVVSHTQETGKNGATVDKWTVKTSTDVTAKYSGPEPVVFMWYKVDLEVDLGDISTTPTPPPDGSEFKPPQITGGSGGSGPSIMGNPVNTNKSATYKVTNTDTYTVQVLPEDTDKYGTLPLAVNCIITGQ